jgi:hypothetical protein
MYGNGVNQDLGRLRSTSATVSGRSGGLMPDAQVHIRSLMLVDYEVGSCDRRVVVSRRSHENYESSPVSPRESFSGRRCFLTGR